MPDDIRQLVIAKAGQYGIDPNIALAQIQRESGFNPRAVGGLGERGLGQFTKATWDSYGSGSFDNAFDPNANLDAWGSYMGYLLNLFGQDYISALTAYNGGPGHLTTPGRYGGPSQAARNYAQAIYAQSGAGNQPSPGLEQLIVAPGGSAGLPAGLIILGLAALVVGIIVLRD